MDTMLNEGHYLGREGCLFRCRMVPEPGATRLATLADIQKSLLVLSRLCGYAILGQEVNSPQMGAKPCSFLPERVHLKMLRIEGPSICKKCLGSEPAVYPKGRSVAMSVAFSALMQRPWVPTLGSSYCSGP